MAIAAIFLVSLFLGRSHSAEPGRLAPGMGRRRLLGPPLPRVAAKGYLVEWRPGWSRVRSRPSWPLVAAALCCPLLLHYPDRTGKRRPMAGPIISPSRSPAFQAAASNERGQSLQRPVLAASACREGREEEAELPAVQETNRQRAAAAVLAPQHPLTWKSTERRGLAGAVCRSSRRTAGPSRRPAPPSHAGSRTNPSKGLERKEQEISSCCGRLRPVGGSK
jgi:hypothetical protein